MKRLYGLILLNTYRIHILSNTTMKKSLFTLITLFAAFQFLNAQSIQTNQSRTIFTAIPGLTIYPADARHGALGETGVATSHDYGDIFWNPARTAFAETRFGFYSAYDPNWLKVLFNNELSLLHIGTYYKFKDNRSAISLSYFNFDQGTLRLSSPSGTSSENANVNDWTLGVNYSKKLSSNFSVGIGLKYVQSNFFSPPNYIGFPRKTTSTIAADISVFHQDNNPKKLINFNYGIYISNISGRMTSGAGENLFFPTNLKIGIAPTLNISPKHSITWTVDVNKLMAPTPTYNVNGKLIEPSSDIEGIFSSFGDAPVGLTEELQEVIWSTGIEYWYDKKYAIRVGKFSESEIKGGRKFNTFGIGTKIINRINVDVAYMYNLRAGSAVGNLLRGNITFGIGKIEK